MTSLYNEFMQKQSNLTEVLKNVFANFVRSLVDFDNEMQNFVSYVSHLDMIITKAYISKNIITASLILIKQKSLF